MPFWKRNQPPKDENPRSAAGETAIKDMTPEQLVDEWSPLGGGYYGRSVTYRGQGSLAYTTADGWPMRDKHFYYRLQNGAIVHDVLTRWPDGRKVEGTACVLHRKIMTKPEGLTESVIMKEAHIPGLISYGGHLRSMDDARPYVKELTGAIAVETDARAIGTRAAELWNEMTPDQQDEFTLVQQAHEMEGLSGSDR